MAPANRLLLSHGVKRSGGGWEGVVSNNGTLGEALVSFEGWITSLYGAHRTQQLFVGHRLGQGHLEATIPGGVKLAAFLPLVGTTHP